MLHCSRRFLTSTVRGSEKHISHICIAHNPFLPYGQGPSVPARSHTVCLPSIGSLLSSVSSTPTKQVATGPQIQNPTLRRRSLQRLDVVPASQVSFRSRT